MSRTPVERIQHAIEDIADVLYGDTELTLAEALTAVQEVAIAMLRDEDIGVAGSRRWADEIVRRVEQARQIAVMELAEAMTPGDA